MNSNTTSDWTQEDTDRALKFWAAYQQAHDVSARVGQAVGIDPKSGQVWFGNSAKDIRRQMESSGEAIPFYCVRVGEEFYVRKGGRR